MAFQLSPGVEINEVDLTTIVPAVATTKAGMAGLFEWGPVGQRVTVASENALVSTFRKPTNQNFPYWFTAANYLAYGRDLQVVRVTDSTSSNATSNGGFSILRNSGEYAEKENSLIAGEHIFVAKYPGKLGNSIAVSISDKTTSSANGGQIPGPPSPPSPPGPGGPPSPPSPPSPPGPGGPPSPPSPPSPPPPSFSFTDVGPVFPINAILGDSNVYAVGGMTLGNPVDYTDSIDLPDAFHHRVFLPTIPAPSASYGSPAEDQGFLYPEASWVGDWPVTNPLEIPYDLVSPIPQSYGGKIYSGVTVRDTDSYLNLPAGTTGTIRPSALFQPFTLGLDIRGLNTSRMSELIDLTDTDLYEYPENFLDADYENKRLVLDNILFQPTPYSDEEQRKRLSVFLAGDDGAWPVDDVSIETGVSIFNAGNQNGISVINSSGIYQTLLGPGDQTDNTNNVYRYLIDRGGSANASQATWKFVDSGSNSLSLRYFGINSKIGIASEQPTINEGDLGLGSNGPLNEIPTNSSISGFAKHPCARHPETGKFLRMTKHTAAWVSLITGIPDTGNFPEMYDNPDDPSTWKGRDGTAGFETPELTVWNSWAPDSTMIKAGNLGTDLQVDGNVFAVEHAPYNDAEYESTFEKMPVFTGRILNGNLARRLNGRDFNTGAGEFGNQLYAILPETFSARGLYNGQRGGNVGIARIKQNTFIYTPGTPHYYVNNSKTKAGRLDINLRFPGAPNILQDATDITFGTSQYNRTGNITAICMTFEKGGYGIARGDVNYLYRFPYYNRNASLDQTNMQLVDEDGTPFITSNRTCRIPLMFAGTFHVDNALGEGAGIPFGVPDDGDGIGTIIQDNNSFNRNFTDGSDDVSSLTEGWRYANLFEQQLPFSSSFADRFDVSNDLVHAIVYDRTGDITGTVGTVLERFSGLSKASNAKRFDGSNNYFKTVINENSKWVYVGKKPSTDGSGLAIGTEINSDVADSSFASFGSQDFTLNGGSDVVPTGGDFYTDGYDQFADPQTVDISLILGGPLEGIQAKQLVEMCDVRKDAVAFISPAKNCVLTGSNSPKSSAVATANIIGYRTGVNATSFGGDTDYSSNNVNVSSSYGFLDSGWKYMYDRYNDIFRFVPLNGDMGGLAARSDDVAEPWFSPAGFNRGQVRNVVKLAFNPVQTQRDNLYSSQVNSVCAFPGEGTVLFGDKTLQSKPSAFDRLNVRRLFIVIEKAIATASKFQLFEQNDAFTRASFRQLIEPFLRDVQSRRGIQDFKVVCDESNNTGEVIDRNEFVADIFIKPTRSINYITLNFVATRTDIDFDEIGGSV